MFLSPLSLLMTLMWNRSDIAHKLKITTWHQLSVIPKIHSNLCCPKAQTYATDTPDRANMDPISNIPWPPLRSDLITAWSEDFNQRIPPPLPPDTRAQSSPRSAPGRRLRFRLLNPSAVLRSPSAPADPSRAFCLMSVRICLPLRPAVSETNHGGCKQRPNPAPWRPVPAQIGFPLTEKKL